MMDFAIGMIIVSICIGSLYGGVYGWLFFGVACMLTGIVEGLVKK